MPDNSNRQFVDTNVLVYAHDLSAGPKHDRAKTLLVELWESGHGCLSIQVLQEFYVTVTQKVPRPLTADAAARIVSSLAAWHVHAPDVDDILEVIELQRRYGLSFWDALIIRSAATLRCHLIWSEDLNPGQSYAGVKVISPFHHSEP